MFDGGAGPEATRRTAERRRVVADAFGAALGRYGAFFARAHRARTLLNCTDGDCSRTLARVDHLGQNAQDA